MTTTPSEFSIWLTPDEESDAYRRLQGAIDDLTTVTGDAPSFEPHVSQTVSALEKRCLLYRERQGWTYRIYPSDDLRQSQS